MKLCMNDILKKENIEEAIENLLRKKDSCGVDGVYVSEFKEYWEMNEGTILEEIVSGVYQPDIVKEREIVLANGKHRKIVNYTCTNRVLLRALSSKFQESLERIFLIV